MEENNHEIKEEENTEESFEELLNRTVIAPVQLDTGDEIEAAVIKITKEWVFIDSGGKSEGYIVIDEFMDEEGNVTVKEGDRIKAYFMPSRNNERLFTTRLAVDRAGKEFLEEAYLIGIPVEGIVEKEIKGGYDVRIAGNVRAFCPYSQMGLHREEHSEKYTGEQLTFKIMEYGEKGRNLILSRRMVLEEERQKQREVLRRTLEEGMTVQGEITSIRKFGAFVDIGGVEGLIPVSEIAWDRVEDIHSVVSIGQKVEAAIKTLDWDNEKFSFSLKEMMPDPWSGIGRKYPEGSLHTGRVARMTSFGAFVTLEPGIDGLVHVSELGKGKRIRHPREVLEDNQMIKVGINRVDEEKRRISLRLIAEDPGSEENESYKKTGTGGGFSTGSFSGLGDLLREKLEKKE